MNAIAEIETVEFAGAALDCVQDERDGEVYVSLRRACEGLGINHASQYRKLQDRHWASVVLMTTKGIDGRVTELAMVDLDTLGMWLATIDANRVNEDAKPKVELYQRECVRVLRRHFFRPAANDEPADNRQPIEREIRYPDGRVVFERFDVPAPMPAPPRPQLTVVPNIDMDELQARFHKALREAVYEHWSLEHLSSDQRGIFYQGLNSKLKNLVMGGRPRPEWTFENYKSAVDYLRARYDFDLTWVFKEAVQ